MTQSVKGGFANKEDESRGPETVSGQPLQSVLAVHAYGPKCSKLVKHAMKHTKRCYQNETREY